MQELDDNDAQEQDSEKPTAEELEEKIRWLKRRRDVYDELQEEMAERGESRSR